MTEFTAGCTVRQSKEMRALDTSQPERRFTVDDVKDPPDSYVELFINGRWVPANGYELVS